MPENPWTHAGLLALALTICTVGMAWLALSIDTHWSQLRGAQPLSRSSAIALRILGTAALAASLLICLQVDHASMAALVWVMAMASSALLVALTLAWRPRYLSALVAWVPADPTGA